MCDVWRGFKCVSAFFFSVDNPCKTAVIVQLHETRQFVMELSHNISSCVYKLNDKCNVQFPVVYKVDIVLQTKQLRKPVWFFLHFGTIHIYLECTSIYAFDVSKLL